MKILETCHHRCTLHRACGSNAPPTCASRNCTRFGSPQPTTIHLCTRMVHGPGFVCGHVALPRFVEYLNLPELVLFTTLTLSQKVVEVLSDAPNFSRSTSPNSPRPASRTIRVLIGFMCESLRKLFDVKAQRTQPLVEDGRSHTGKPISRHVHSGFYFNPEGGGICPVNWPCL